MREQPACWCGAEALTRFSAEYWRCRACETLVSGQMPGPEIARVVDEERDFYGREYWFSYQEKELGHPSIVVRVRTDLPERCLHWLRTVLKYKLPPARVLELGSGHGGFVAMLGWAGYEATGLEVSPWVVKFAGETFGVPMLLGPVEDQELEAGSLDVVVLMDILEHLRDPEGTIRHCLRLLKADGVMLIQTPCYPAGRTYEELEAQGDRFLEQLQAKEHLYLFSQGALEEFLRRLGVAHIVFEPPIFAEYDMFAVVSRVPLQAYGVGEIEQALSGRPGGRLVQALVDVAGQLGELKQRYAEAEADRVARLGVIHEQGQRLGELEAERNAQEQQIQAIMVQLTTLQQVLRAIQTGCVYKLLRRLGRWRWVEDVIAQPPAPAD